MNAVLQMNRNAGLGASDAAPAIGLSKWKTPYQLWAEKTGLAASDAANDPDSEALHLEMGKVLEPVAIARFEKKLKYSVGRRGEQVVDQIYPWRWVTLDGVASDGGLIEAKSVGFAHPDEWGDELEDGAIPMQYLIQVQHGLAITGFQHAWVPVIILNRQFRVYRVERDQELIDMMTLKEAEFWNHVQTRTPPPAIDYEDATRQWSRDDATAVMATPEILAAVLALAEAKTAKKAAELAEDAAKVPVCAFMKEHGVLKAPDGKVLVTWKTAAGSTKVNLESLRAKYPAIVKEFEFTQPGSRRLLVK
jgi:putative phage-type endonuclease